MKKIAKLIFKNIGFHVKKSFYSNSDLLKYKIIFIHVPKVAGNGLLKSLNINSSNHIHLALYEFEDVKKFKEYFKIGFVRNPWDRFVSSYYYLKKGGMNNEYDLSMQEKLKRFNEFEDFVFELLYDSKFRNEILKEIHFSTQYSWLMNLEGEIEMDYIGRFENLEEGFLLLKEKLGRNSAELKKYNSSKHKPYWEYYTKEMVEAVRNIYAKDIDTFNYSFPYEKIQ